jgi:GNAT superfamily N-acetyltransferase
MRVLASMPIRTAIPDDATVIARLLLELGYECDASRMRRRIERLLAASDHAVWVALDEDEVVACAHAQIGLGLVGPPEVELAALVVTREHRRGGYGRTLVRAVEHWAASRGIYRVIVRSQVHRTDARDFYLKLGYLETKQQSVFVREPREHRPAGPTTLVD